MPAERQVIGLGCRAPRDFLLMPGVVVSGHIGRNVSRVLFGDEPAYLKREHRVRLRDRLRSFLDGFGQASLSRREYLVIRRLREHGLPAPQLLANGEADGQAFLLLAQADGAVELNRTGRGRRQTRRGTWLSGREDSQRRRRSAGPVRQASSCQS